MSVYKPKKSPFYSYDFELYGVRFYGSTKCRSKREAETLEKERRVEAQLIGRDALHSANSPMGTSNNDDFVVGSTAVAGRRSFSLLIWRGCVSAFCGRRPVQGASGEPRHYAAAIRSSVTSRRIL